ncbi:MAG: hypothetical protein ABI333_13970 [bacterium]
MVRLSPECRRWPCIAVVSCCVLVAGAAAARSAPAGETPVKPPPSGVPGPSAPAKVRRPPAPVKPWAKGVSAEDRVKALAMYRKGNKLFEDSQYKEALREYLKAIKVWDHPAIAYNIAECYVNLERPLDAYRNLKHSLRYGEAPIKKHFKQAQMYMRLLMGRLGRVRVECKRPGVRVTLDGKLLFIAPGKATRIVLASTHVLVASKRKYLTETKTVSVFPGRTVKVLLDPLPIRKLKLVRRWKRWIPWTVVGVGLAVAAAGVPMAVKAVASFRKYDQGLTDECPDGCLPEDRPGWMVDLRSKAELERGVAVGLLVASGGVLAAGLTLVLLNLPRALREKSSAGKKNLADRVIIAPSVAPNGATFTTGFRF